MIRKAFRLSASVIDGGVAVVAAVGGATADGLRWIADYGVDDGKAATTPAPDPDTTPTEG